MVEIHGHETVVEFESYHCILAHAIPIGAFPFVCKGDVFDGLKLVVFRLLCGEIKDSESLGACHQSGKGV